MFSLPETQLGKDPNSSRYHDIDMSRPILPVEVCESIIDLCRREPGLWESPQWIWQSYARLTACSLTCKDWLPRSRRSLYTIVILTDPPRFDTFASSIFRNPFLGDFVREVRVQSHNAYIPFAMSELLQKLPNVYSLVFDTDISLYPTSYMVLVSQYPITCLSIWDLSLFPSWATLFNFIWAFPELSKLRLGSHLDGLPGEKDIVDELTLAKGARLSAIVARGRCSRLRTLELYDIWYLCPNFPPKGVFGNALDTLIVKVGERVARAAQSAMRAPPGFPLLKDFAARPTLKTLEIHLTRYALAPTHETWRHQRMANELQILVQSMYANNCSLRKLSFRFAAPETTNDLSLPFNAKLLLGTYFHHLFVGPIQLTPAWRFLRQIEIELPSNDLPTPCLAADWWMHYLRANAQLPFDGDIEISVSFHRAYSYLDPDETLPPAWYCIRHRAAVVSTICTEECFKKGPLPYDIAEGFEELRI